MSIDSARHQDPAFIRRTFSSIANRYDLANHALSLGADFFWRERASRLVASWRPSAILDLATGSGDLALVLKKRNPGARVVGADFCQPMLLEAQRKGVSPLVAADGLALPFRAGSFDAVTVAFGLRNMASREQALREMARVLRVGGHVVVLDFSLPEHPALCTAYRAYLHHVLPRLAGAVTGNAAAYEYLGESIEEFPSGARMVELIERCGFESGRAMPLWLGIVTIYSATRR